MRVNSVSLAVLLLAAEAASAHSPVKVSPSETGRCDDSLRHVGDWNYYDEPDSLSLTLNYSNASLLYVKKDDVIQYVKTSINWQPLVVQRPARFVGSMQNLYAHYEGFYPSFLGPFSGNMLFPGILKVVVWLSFEVSADGRAENPVEKIEPAGSTPELEASLIAAFQNAPNLWLPAIIGKSEVRVKYAIPFIFFRGYCGDISFYMPGKIGSYGKVLFTVSRFSESKDREIAVKNPFTIIPNKSMNQLEWTPDGQHIIFKKTTQKTSLFSTTGNIISMYRIAASGQLIDTYLLTEDNHITCLSGNCTEFIIEFSGWLKPLLMVCRSQFGSMTYAGPTPTLGHFYNPDLKTSIILKYKSTGSDSLKLYQWPPVTNQLTEFRLKKDQVTIFSKSLNWVDENTLLYTGLTENRSQFFFLYDIRNKTRTYLPMSRVKFVSVSPFNKHDIRVGIENDIPGLNAQLYLYNVETNQEKKLSPNKYDAAIAFFGSNDKQLFFLSKNNLYELDLETRKIKKVLSGIYGVDIDLTRTEIVLRKTQDLYLLDIKTRHISKIFTEAEHKLLIE
jgi:hypothetical protein